MKFKALVSLTFLFVFMHSSLSFAGIIKGKVKTRSVRNRADVVVYLAGVEGEFSAPDEYAVLDQKNLLFIPHVLPILVGTTVDFPNSDEVRHNVFSPTKDKKFNLGTYASGVTRQQTFDKPGAVTLLCNVHAEMVAYVVVLENPYFAVTNNRGDFEIKNVPAGTFILKTWHEKLKESKQEITVLEDGIVNIELQLRR
jgi:plastocyanin